MRRSPVSFPTWLQSARESICACPRQLSSAKAASNFESAFRSSAARLAPRVTVSAPASFSSLARRRCLRRDRIIRAAHEPMQYPQTSGARLSTRKLTSPRQPTPIPAIHSAIGHSPPPARPIRPTKGHHDATKPLGLPQTASLARGSICACPRQLFIGQDGVELRIGIAAGELLVARASSFPPT